MATNYTSLLGFALPTTGELAGTWGTVVNDNITELVEDSIAATATASVASGDWTLTTTGSGAANEARCAILIPTGSPGVSRNIIAPAQSKAYVVINQSNAAVVVKGSATTGTTIGAGDKAVVAWSGSDFVTIASTATDGVSTISFGTTGLTPSTATSGAVTVAGTLAVGNGGTGATSLTGVLKGNGTSAFTASNVSLTSEVTGTLPVGNGGTGATSLTANNVILGNGTSAVQFVAPGTNGNVLTSNGTTWTSAAAAAGDVTAAGNNAFTGANTFYNSTGQTFGTATSTNDGIILAGRAGGTSSYRVTLQPTTLSASRTVTLPNANTTIPIATQPITFSGPSAARTYTFPDANATVLTTNAAVTVAQGGTGATTLTANNVILGNGTSAVQFVAPGTNGNVLTSNGTTWVSQAAGASLTGITSSGSPYTTALGYQAADSISGATSVTAVGYQAGTAITSGGANTFVGYTAGVATTTGYNNTYIGSSSGVTNTTGESNTAVGFASLNKATTSHGNTAVGSNALENTTTGAENTAVGRYALITNTTGYQNTAVGSYSQYSTTSGYNNSSLGYQTLYSNTTGRGNTAVGFFAMYTNTTGRFNTAIGDNALSLNSTGIENVAVGADAGAGVTGSENVLVGSGAGQGGPAGLTSGSGNVCIGFNSGPSTDSATNQIVIGPSVAGQANSNVTIGSSSGKIYAAYTSSATWTQTSDGTMKTVLGPDSLGLSFINRLNPILFKWKPQNELPENHPYYSEVNGRDTETVIHGFVAQEVKAAMDAEGCTTFNGWDQGPDGIQAISREMFISPLVKAVQELSEINRQQQESIDALKARCDALESRCAALEQP